MNTKTNTLIFYDNEDLDEKIRHVGERIFLQPFKAEGRANKTMLIDSNGKEQEYILNLKEQYIFNNYTYDFGRLMAVDGKNYRILWSKNPEKREVLNIESKQIYRKATKCTILHSSPIISIIMPFYNISTTYLQESIDSILNQTFADFELIAIDDGSTDFSGEELIKMYKDRRIRLISNRHDFIDSLNRSVKEAKGKYIVLMDADNIMLPHRLETQYGYMEAHPEIDVCGSFMEILGTGQKNQVPVNHEEIITSMLLNNPIVHSTVILRKKTLLEKRKSLYTKGYIAAEDYKLWTDLALENCIFANIPEVLLKYRLSKNLVTGNHWEEERLSAFKIKMEYAEQIIEKVTESNEKLTELFNPLIDLVNKKHVKTNVILNIVYHIYSNYLDKNDPSCR
ncbi:MAG: glycosyltransferase [Prevotella sp.]|jgi:glycosyltransferase involved in cell wall biosynthesis|nr:glycosyltransferase [Prevotella sp.]